MIQLLWDVSFKNFGREKYGPEIRFCFTYFIIECWTLWSSRKNIFISFIRTVDSFSTTASLHSSPLTTFLVHSAFPICEILILNQYQPLPLYSFSISILEFAGISVNSRCTFQYLSATASIPAPCRNSLSVPGFSLSVCVSLFFIHTPFHLYPAPWS